MHLSQIQIISILVLVVAVVGISSYFVLQPAGLFVKPAPEPEPEQPLLSQTPKQVDKTAYFYANGQKIVSMDAGGILYYITDHLGGTNKVYDQDGNLVSEVEYYAYGQDKTETGQGQDYKYTGKEEDDTTGLYYYGARYYEPLIGKFLAIDKVKGDIKDPQSLNRYSYTKNNPLIYVDPDGNDEKKSNLIIYSTDFRGDDLSTPITPYVVNFADTLERNVYMDSLESVVNNIAQQASEGNDPGEFDFDIPSNTISMPDSVETNIYSLPDLELIPSAVSDAASKNGNIQKLIIAAHGGEYQLDDTTSLFLMSVESGDTATIAYKHETITDILSNIDTNDLAEDAVIYILTCHGSKCLNSQEVANNLNKPVWSSPEAVLQSRNIQPAVMGGVFDLYEPEKQDTTRR